MADTKIRRHTKIKQDANPYDAEWELYFEQRITRKLKEDLRGKTSYVMGQKGICPECNQRRNLHRSWEVHHVVYRCHGGSDLLDNLVLLHPNCHRQLHSRDHSRTIPGRRESYESLSRVR